MNLPGVPACFLCNTLLGSYPAESLPERASYLHERYRNRYALILLSEAHWSDDEIDDLDTTLKSHVAYRNNVVKHLEARLDMLACVAASERA